MSNRYSQIHQDLDHAEAAGSATDALQHLHRALTQISRLLDDRLADAVIDDELSLAAAGKHAGLTENAVGPRLAGTARLAPYATGTGRVTAADVKAARRDMHARTPLPPTPPGEPLRFKPRRKTTPS